MVVKSCQQWHLRWRKKLTYDTFYGFPVSSVNRLRRDAFILTIFKLRLL